MTTGEGGGHDEEGPTAVWEGVGIVSSLDLVAVIIFLYFIKLNILKTLNLRAVHFSA